METQENVTQLMASSPRWGLQAGRTLSAGCLLAGLLLSAPRAACGSEPPEPGHGTTRPDERGLEEARLGVEVSPGTGAVGELIAETAGLVRQLTLATVSESQRQQYRRLRDRFEAVGGELREAPGYARVGGLLHALGELLLEDAPARAIPVLEALEGAGTDPQSEVLVLVLLGVAHHRASGQNDGHQEHTRQSEMYFERAEAHPQGIALASNGLGVQWALRGFRHLEHGEIEPALPLLRGAEEKFARAAELDGTAVAVYRHANNTAYIREKLLVAFLDGHLTRSALLSYSDQGSVEDFIETMDQRMARARGSAEPGSWAAAKASAECDSIAGEYFQRSGAATEAGRRLAASRRAYLEAVDQGLHQGEAPEEVRRSLMESRLLAALAASEGALDEILGRLAQRAEGRDPSVP